MEYGLKCTSGEESYLNKVRQAEGGNSTRAWDGIVQRTLFLNRSHTKILVVSLDYGKSNFQPTVSIKGHRGVVHVSHEPWHELITCIRRTAVTAFRADDRRNVEETTSTLSYHTVQTLCYVTGNLIKIADRDDPRSVIFLGEPSVRRLLDLTETIAVLLKHYSDLQRDILKWYTHFLKVVQFKIPADNSTSEHKNIALAQMRILMAKESVSDFDTSSLYAEIGEDKIYSDVYAAAEINAIP
jgi:hypothetical protein